MHGAVGTAAAGAARAHALWRTATAARPLPPRAARPPQPRASRPDASRQRVALRAGVEKRYCVVAARRRVAVGWVAASRDGPGPLARGGGSPAAG